MGKPLGFESVLDLEKGLDMIRRSEAE